MSICSKGFDENWCPYREDDWGCERCLVGQRVELVMVCHECGGGFSMMADFDEQEHRCPECGGVVEIAVVCDGESVEARLLETYLNSIGFLKNEWKGLSKKPLGVHVDSSGNEYVKHTFGRESGWNI